MINQVGLELNDGRVSNDLSAVPMRKAVLSSSSYIEIIDQRAQKKKWKDGR